MCITYHVEHETLNSHVEFYLRIHFAEHTVCSIHFAEHSV